MTTIGERIKSIRLTEGESQEEMAERLGITSLTLNRIEENEITAENWLIKLIWYEYLFNEEWVKKGTGEARPFRELKTEKLSYSSDKSAKIDKIEKLGKQGANANREKAYPDRFFLKLILSTFISGVLLLLFRMVLELIKGI